MTVKDAAGYAAAIATTTPLATRSLVEEGTGQQRRRATRTGSSRSRVAVGTLCWWVALSKSVCVAVAADDESGVAQPAGEHGDSVHNIGAGAAAKDMDLDAWCAAKNSDVGPPVSAALKNTDWELYRTPSNISRTTIPGLTEGVPGMTFHGALGPKECKALISAFPKEGAGYMPGDRVAELYRDRKVKARVLAQDDKLAEVLFERLRDYLPQELDGGSLYRINPNFRFIHYETGGHHSTHIDGREPGVPRFDENVGGYVQSRLTLQVYLNTHGSDFSGGEFEIVAPDPSDESRTNVRHTIRPSAGDAVVFYQERLTPPSAYPPYELQHEGSDVTSGEKFACRTMVDYVFPDKERAQMGNVKDDKYRTDAATPLSATCEDRTKHRASILAVGNTIIDTILTVPFIPIDEKLLVQTKKRYVGGQGANGAQALALLGPKVTFATRVGDDLDGLMARRRYEALGMDLSLFVEVPNATTSSAVVVVSTGEQKQRNSMIHDDPAMYAKTPELETALLEAERRLAGKEFGAVYTDGWQLDMALPIVRAARRHKVHVVTDIEVWNNSTRELASLATVLIANGPILRELAAELTGEDFGIKSGKSMQETVLVISKQRPHQTVVATEGPGGSSGAAPGTTSISEIIHVPAVLADVRDTTGAGDTYHAGYVDALVRGLPLESAMRFATHAAAAKCETPGSSVTEEALKRFGVLRSAC
mmetsp:Transcript_52693/g.112445  ORF Transcript_52693/g.112445 Transcript_52693/m.112445 type:complete len:706 (+) Transcript_52693:108-2225(+)|eukprot:CAMPEP_0206473722 /NCGR_PEP_ID=MMETSP0324_2-20121206/33051_1 /ASSEMBLY_ACC=CAM_ASM_000836 /TAXON_ID=2866 /ORGANISM="Crypthecodinium cohnii, Strain Seligo" /LENGTH=705 /DNA_ID=CAMNT_0053948739 /DNA_START=34 /DNA_END=2151 /DNA_ORIENTATION=+